MILWNNVDLYVSDSFVSPEKLEVTALSSYEEKEVQFENQVFSDQNIFEQYLILVFLMQLGVNNFSANTTSFHLVFTNI